MVIGDISRLKQVSSAKTNPEINETLEGLPKKLEKEQVGGEYELIKRYLSYITKLSLLNAVSVKWLS